MGKECVDTLVNIEYTKWTCVDLGHFEKLHAQANVSLLNQFTSKWSAAIQHPSTRCTTKIPKLFPQMVRTKIVHTSGILFDLLWVNFSIFGVEKDLQPMLIYRVKYTESESDIKNYNFLYKKKKQNTFDFVEMLRKVENIKKQKTIFYFVFCINCIIHILEFLDIL